MGKMLNSSISQAEVVATRSDSAGKLHLKRLINKVGSSAPRPPPAPPQEDETCL